MKRKSTRANNAFLLGSILMIVLVLVVVVLFLFMSFKLYDKKNTYTIKDGEYGLANVAATVASILNLKAPECWEDSMI